MNILIIPSWYPKESDDTYGSFFREQAIALADYGHKVFVLNACFTEFKNVFHSSCAYITKQNDNGVIVYRKMIPSLGFSRSVSLCLAIYRRRIEQLLACFERENPDIKIDIIHAHCCYPAGSIACEIGEKKHIPVVITEHRSNYLRKNLPKEHIELVKNCISRCDQFICVSKNLKNIIGSFTHYDQNNIIVIPNMVPDFFFNKIDCLKNRKNFSFISVGGLISRKRHMQLLRCFTESFRNIPCVQLVIIGEGPERSRLEAFIDQNGLNERVHLVGKKSRKEIFQCMHENDVFVLTSSMETFGVVYIEAMACGLPVIGSRNGGADDIIKDYNGILVDVDDDAQLINALKLMYNQAKNYDPVRISRETGNLYSEKVICSMLTDIYGEIVFRPQKGSF